MEEQQQKLLVRYRRPADYRARNILTMAERIKVIEAYDRKPNYQHLARLFGCSAKQIKNIVAHRDELMVNYKDARANRLAQEFVCRRQEKIDFLGKVVYEFLLRALYLRIPVGTTIIRQKAFHIKEAIAIENFSPNQAWLDDFKATYNRLDSTNMLDNLPDDMHKRQSLKCVDLIEYVSRQENEKRRTNKPIQADDENCNNMWGSNDFYSDSNTKQSSTEKFIAESHDEYFNIYKDNSNNGNALIPESDESMEIENTSAVDNVELPIKVKLELDEYRREKERNLAVRSLVVKTVKRDSRTNVSKSNSSPTKRAAQPPPSSTPPALPDIHSYLEALSHLKVLEDFAMIEENYRAIGLITQLEQIFKNPPKLKRI